MIGSQYFAVMGFKSLIGLYCFQIFGSHDQVIQFVSFIINRLQSGKRNVGIAVSAISFIIIKTYYLINHISGVDKLSDWLGMSLVKKDFCCFLMKHNNFPAFLDIDFIDKTSFEKLHDFYLCMIGIYAGKVQADVFLSETKINASLPHGCSGLDDMIREIMTGSIHVFIVQLHPSSFFQSVV